MPPNRPATPEDVSALVARIASVLREAVEHAVQHRAPLGHAPAPGSQAASEIEAQPALATTMRNAVGPQADAEPVETAFAQAQTLMASAADHLLVLAGTLDPFAPWAGRTLARGTVEAAARAWWLLDPTINPTQRIARSLTERVHDLRSQRTILREMTRVTDEERAAAIEHIESALATAAGMAVALGVEPINDDRGGMVAAGARRPETTHLVAQALPEVGRVLYRIYSATAHGVSHGLMSNFDHVQESGLSRPIATVRDVGLVSMAALRGWVGAFHREATMYGYNMDGWQAWRQQALTVVNTALS